MKRLSTKALEAEIAKMQHELAPERYQDADWSHWHKPARLEFPLGELTNPAIKGFVWAWHMQGKINTARNGKTDKFSAQGLEGKVTIETVLTTALIAAVELPTHRRAVYV